MSDAKRLTMTVLMATWVMSFAYAFYDFATTPAGGGGFIRGLNRITEYLGWQAIAGTIAIAIAAIGRDWPKGSAVRRLSLLPFSVALLHIAGLVAVFIWAQTAS